VLSIVASDRPGLLYDVARTLARYRMNLQTARVNTLGDRVEDVFLITGPALTDSRAVLNLEQDLLKALVVQQTTPVAA
jgi:[protein-PII] uridylyltransferase